MTIRQANFALRIVERRTGRAAILYRRILTEDHKERLKKVAPISPLAFTAGSALLHGAARASGVTRLTAGPFIALDPDWGARVACYALVAAGLRNADRLHRAASELQGADGTEAAWWYGLMTSYNGKRAVRALRIIVEAVE